MSDLLPDLLTDRMIWNLDDGSTVILILSSFPDNAGVYYCDFVISELGESYQEAHLSKYLQIASERPDALNQELTIQLRAKLWNTTQDDYLVHSNAIVLIDQLNRVKQHVVQAELRTELYPDNLFLQSLSEAKNLIVQAQISLLSSSVPLTGLNPVSADLIRAIFKHNDLPYELSDALRDMLAYLEFGDFVAKFN